MPLIRYELGDIAVLSDDECGCGVKLPIMKRIEGRQVDCIRLPIGRLVSPYTLTEIIRHFNGIKQYQIVQEESDRILVKIVPRPGFEDKVTADWPPRFELVGDTVTIEPQVVSSISVGNHGKYKYVSSKVN